MKKKYIFPLQIFIILEKINLNFWTSNNLSLNNYFLYLPNNYIILFSYLLKYELFLNKTTLIENSAFELKTNNFLKTNIFKKKINQIFLIFYNFFNYNSNLRLNVLFFLTNNNSSIFSLDKIFKNANWLERETSEMYGIFFYQKYDSRKLLLDYSKNENPMLKDFPSEGLQDVFFNFFENQVTMFKNEIVEL